jgi:hypothetical protein
MASLILSTKGNEPKAGELLRQDTKGRVRTGRERREALLAEFDRSGVSGARFARMVGIKYATFANWLHVRRHAGSAPARRGPGAVTWVEAAPPATAALRVELPGGAWMEIGSREQARVAAVLLGELAGSGAKPC